MSYDKKEKLEKSVKLKPSGDYLGKRVGLDERLRVGVALAAIGRLGVSAKQAARVLKVIFGGTTNQFLIAAAPDLLAACKAMWAVRCDAPAFDCQEPLDMIERAITKAEPSIEEQILEAMNSPDNIERPGLG